MTEGVYNFQTIESCVSQIWREKKAFEYAPDNTKPSYTIILPPPNITGSLHLGHALCFTIQDILIRYKRMKGFNVLWQAGLDHAGIVTQLVVEKQLTQEGVNPKELSRDELISKIWEWKKDSGSTILNQMYKLGCSIDLSRVRFTMDEKSSKTVIETFVQLYKNGLIYKDTRLVNWDPKLQSAVSDLEVVEKEQNGKLYYIRYKIENSENSITVATTRPETLFGDTAIAVNPDDERYKCLVGSKVIVPLCNRVIPIVADEYSNPEKGSGAVKITPAHDFNDFEVGKRHNLEEINIFDHFARLNETVPEEFRGLDRFSARTEVVSKLEKIGILEKTEDIVHVVPYGDRSGVVIEPYLTEQWFVDAPQLAKKAIEVVLAGEVTFVPKNWTNTYFEWMKNIKPWCISRQIIWGHRIPAWYGPDGHVFVAHSKEEANNEAIEYYGKETPLEEETDVLDTWYSSSLWPFSTLDWLEGSDMLDKHYPNDVLVTGFDIIFFWVARMIMMGEFFNKKPPFKNVYIHALVRDAHGNKMSKSKGNVIDPLNLINEFGADALRFAMAAFATPGRDICISSERINGYKGLLTKLWNAMKFAKINGCFESCDFSSNLNLTLDINKWILSKMYRLITFIDDSIARYRFDEYANQLYHFLWHDFCDWYLEFSKSVFSSSDTGLKHETASVMSLVLYNFSKLLCPIAPFICEYLNKEYFKQELLMYEALPDKETFVEDQESLKKISFVQQVVNEIRSIRKELNIPFSIIVQMSINTPVSKELIGLIAKLGKVRYSETPVNGTLKFVVDHAEIAIEANGFDVDAQKVRLRQELEKIENAIYMAENQLQNQQFLLKASETVVNSVKTRMREMLLRRDKLKNLLF